MMLHHSPVLRVDHLICNGVGGSHTHNPMGRYMHAFEETAFDCIVLQKFEDTGLHTIKNNTFFDHFDLVNPLIYTLLAIRVRTLGFMTNQ